MVRFLNCRARKKEASPTSHADVDKATEERYRVFKEKMSGTRLTGKFTVTGMEGRDPITEQYDILEVEKLPQDDYWRLKARIKYQRSRPDRPNCNPGSVGWQHASPDCGSIVCARLGNI